MTETTAQQPIASGFGHESNSQDVMAGVNLTGAVAVVTGGYSGLGLETTNHLARAGAHVIIPARRTQDAARAVDHLGDAVTVLSADLADLDSVSACAQRISDTWPQIDLFIGAAGIMATPLQRVGQGWESQFAVNHLGHFAFVADLWPSLVRGNARVVAYSSAGHHISGIWWNDPQFTTGYDKWEAYGQSKTANILFALHLDSLGAATGVRAFSLHPGSILTPLQRHLESAEMVDRGWIDGQGNVADPTFKTVSQGAATGLWAATSPQLAGLGGLYLEDCDIAGPAAADGTGVMDYAVDPREAESLWNLSVKLTGRDLN
ncbi:oxidoreductase [Mycolicibacterium llatzerense]|uniref:Probable oxidoreductase n=1 Tax=Mycolicibacterium llatzerense TaxID=280871 RepID=A0A0D1J107_9MYCO|nr:oxidoreductase [Mycolicibacterium llatzerense]KIU15218.1 oxidoreductase [Mycolicibacterium llatzerense]